MSPESKKSASQAPAKRNTPQKQAVKHALGEAKGFVSAQQLHQTLKNHGSTIGLATVYRTLDAMVERGDVAAVRTGNAVRYDLTHHHHHHLICQICGNVTDVDATEVPSELITFFESETGFDLSNATIQLNGTCAGCSSTH